MDFDAIWQVHFWALITHYIRCGGEREIWGSTPAKTCIASLQPNRHYTLPWWIQTSSWVDLHQRFCLLPKTFVA